MSEVVEDRSDTVIVSRRIDASARRVFEAWTQPDTLAKWFGPEGVEVTDVRVDLVEGGRYDLHIRTPEGVDIHHYGEYREIHPFRRLSFTWMLDGQACGGSAGVFVETFVDITLEERVGGVNLTLSHSGLPTKAACEGHVFGWNSSLDSCEHFLRKEG